MKLSILAIGLNGLLNTVALSAETSPEEKSLMARIVSVQREREKLYGNMHAVWTETKTKGGKTTVNQIEFWSCEHKYFRVDLIRVSGSVKPHKIIRTIILPERSVRVFSQDRNNLGAVFKFGEVQDSFGYVRGDQWYCQANKTEHDHIHELITGWLSGETRCDSFDVKRRSNGDVIITAFDDRGEYKDTEKLTLSSADYRFLKSDYRIDGPNEFWREGVDTKAYDDEQIDIPITSSRACRGSDIGAETLTYKLEELQLEPAPIEVFFPDELAPLFAPPGGASWFRRLLLLGIGIACLGAYYYRRRSNLQSDGISNQPS